MEKVTFSNPFRPGAGHPPPYLAGRQLEQEAFREVLRSPPILDNIVLTGLRGIGKTALLESFRPLTQRAHWLWVEGELSEAANINEDSLVARICTDIALITSTIDISAVRTHTIGFTTEPQQAMTLNFSVLMQVYNNTPGLAVDKLKAVLTLAWQVVSRQGNTQGIMFSFDEAQILSDQPDKDQYPLSLLIDTFKSLQRQGLPVVLVLAGLPTLFPKMVEVRTYTERMFNQLVLNNLSPDESREAIRKPIEDTRCPIQLSDDSVQQIVEMSGGYPYFIQFICREVYDAFSQRQNQGLAMSIPAEEIERKLHANFFSGRWSKTTDRQRDLLQIIAQLELQENEFTIKQIQQASQHHPKPYSSGHISQILTKLAEQGWLFRNRHGRYTFGLPLLQSFIKQQAADD